ncbi:MAG: hypothetical protein IJL69_04665 [Oscillospiraceae bacterium]|nr:hypothetical protein [Oscillospiraceae bacterium]
MTEYNLETGRPPADVAVTRLASIVARERVGRAGAIKIIHGYGSSGVGGRIRVEARRWLAAEKARGRIRAFIPGEEFSIFSAETRALLERFPEVRRDRDLERSNGGVTVVVF